jgi:hypothetical protein
MSWIDISGSSWTDLTGLVEEILNLITGNAAGEPVQVPEEDVRIVPDGLDWQVQWRVYGDDSEVVEYEVSFAVFEPHSNFWMEIPGGTVPAGQHYFPIPSGVIDDARLHAPDDFLAYLEPFVAPVTVAGSEPGSPGAARPLTELLGYTHLVMQQNQRYFGPAIPVGSLDDLPHPGSCARRFKEPIACRGYVYDAPHYGYHLELRLDPADTWLRAIQEWPGPIALGNDWRFVGHVGFAIPSVSANRLDVHSWLQSDANPNVLDSQLAVQTDELFLRSVDQPFAAAAAGALMTQNAIIENVGGLVDPDQSVLFLGLRLVRP